MSVVFASADFGASGVIYVCLAVAWVLVFAVCLVGLLKGSRLLRTGSDKARKYGIFLILFSGAIPLFCCLIPPHAVRVVYGNYPLGDRPKDVIKNGISTAEVESLLGRPHERYREPSGEDWCYWIDTFGGSSFHVRFDPDGRVLSTD